MNSASYENFLTFQERMHLDGRDLVVVVTEKKNPTTLCF